MSERGCMACVVRDNPFGRAEPDFEPDFAYLVGLHDEARAPGLVREHLCESHQREYAELVSMLSPPGVLSTRRPS